MLILIAPNPAAAAHLLDRQSRGPLCGTKLKMPATWEIALVRPGALRVCRACWRKRFEPERLW